jgi:hypothetical protein
MKQQRISGKEAVRVAEDMAKPGPIRVVAASEAQEAPGALVPSPGSELDRKAPPRVRKPLPRNDQWKAPTPDLEGHRKRLREALGNTLSDEFVDVILGKLVEALRPGLYDQLDEATLNAALATIDSMQPRSELQALLAVQIIATGFAGLRFLRQSHRQMTEDYIDVYGGYAIKLLRLWLSPGVKRPNMSTEQTACDRPAGATDIRRSDWEPWVHSQGSLLFSGERPVTAAATVDGTRRGAVVESSVELTPSPHGSLSSPLPRSCVSSCRAVVWLDQFLRA